LHNTINPHRSYLETEEDMANHMGGVRIGAVIVLQDADAGIK
jgi:hypothetical protein